MSWRPRTLAGQLFALLLSALVVTHLVVVGLLLQLRTEDEIHPLTLRDEEQRMAAAYRVAVANPEGAQALIAQLSAPKALLEIVPMSPRTGAVMGEQEAQVAQRLRAHLQLPAGVPVQVLLEQISRAEPSWWNLRQFLSEDNTGNIWTLDVDIGLPDGRILHSRTTPTMMHGHWSRVLSFSIPVGLFPIFLIAMVFGRRFMQPLRALTNAAKRISRGERVPPIAVKGPADMRELIDTFNDMQNRLSRYVGDRTRMIAALGHDLRTPLTSLRIRAELIEDAPLREAMIVTLNEMTTMTEEILQFAQDDATQEATQNIRMDALLAEVLEAQQLIGNDVVGTLGTDVDYDCRPIHLKRALNNLIENAARYGQVRVHSLVDGAKRELIIHIDDDGPGIPQAHLEQVFEPFVRLDVTRNVEMGAGTGLGLAIARSCVRAHGGEVRVHNRPEGGLRAVVSLPL